MNVLHTDDRRHSLPIEDDLKSCKEQLKVCSPSHSVDRQRKFGYFMGRNNVQRHSPVRSAMNSSENVNREEISINLPLKGHASLNAILEADFELETSVSKPFVADDNENVENIIVEDPAPDGGYGWVIVFASFMCNLIVDGIAYTFGLFFEYFVREFRASNGKTALAGSLLSGCYLSAGPLVGALTNKFGCRAVTIAGSILSSLGFLLATFSPNITMLLITYGIMGGLGFGLIYLPAIVSVGYYFSSKRAFATGVAVCGSGVGAFIFAPFCRFLLKTYDWKGSLLIFSGVALNGAVFGALMRPLIINAVSIDDENDENGNREEKISNLEPGVQSMSHLPNISSSTLLIPNGNIDYQKAVEQNKVRSTSTVDTTNPSNIRMYCGRRCGRYAGERTVSECYPPSVALNFFTSTDSLPRHNSFNSQQLVVPPFSKKDVLYSRSSLDNDNILKSERRPSRVKLSAKDILDKVKHEHSIPSPSPKLSFLDKCKRFFNKSWKSEESVFDKCISPSVLSTMLDTSLIRESHAFQLLSLSNVLGMMAFYIPFVYITQHVTSAVKDGDENVSADRASLLLSSIGVTNILGRLIFGWISDKIAKVSTENSAVYCCFTALFINNCCLAVAGVVTILVPFCHNYYSILAICSVFGLCVAGYMCLTSIILVDLLGLEKLTNAFGLISLCRGVASMIGPPLAGVIFDKTGSFNLTFYVAGILFLLSSITSSAIFKFKSQRSLTK